MRKNKNCRENIALTCTYKVEGLNLDRFINHLKKQGVSLYNIKKMGNNRLIVTVSFNQSRKFFAIAKELCYNIKKVKENGKALPLLMLWRRVGIVVGAIIFSIACYFFNDFIYVFSF